MRVFGSCVVFAGCLLVAPLTSAQVPHPGRVGLSLEGLTIFQQRNDVRIPPVGGTDFSIVDLVGAAPAPAIRGELTVDLTKRQEVRFVTWKVGFTGFVRDARIALTQPGRAVEDTDVGIVPLGHVRADARVSSRVSLGFELDGTAAPPKRKTQYSAPLDSGRI